MPVTFTYDFSVNPRVSNVRLLIADTDPTAPIFGDDEIEAAFFIQASTTQSSMRYNNGQYATLPASPVSYLRVAALLLDALASNKARLAVTRLLDADADFGAASKALHAQAAAYREVDDNSGAFAIIEQCHNGWTFLDRYYKTIQRQTAQ